MKQRSLAIVVLFAGILAYLLWPDDPTRALRESQTLDVVDLLGGDDNQGYQRAWPGDRPELPVDHGPHPDFRSEWWYFTGNLHGQDRRHFGFQLTFFRFAIAPDPVARASAWGTRQLWMAHLALTDTEGRRFFSQERLTRGAQGLAGARSQPFRVWLEDWSVSSLDESFLPLSLVASEQDFALDLRLEPGPAPVFQGDDGYSAKGPEPGNASMYYSFTRMPASGAITIDGVRHPVAGLAWLDREWSTSALGPELAGWDWFSMQLDDGSDLMFYRLRRSDGSSDPLSAGMLREAAGDVVRLDRDSVQLTPLAEWVSPSTGVRYPLSWSLKVPSQDLDLLVEPHLDAQEMDHSVRYWEGAIRIQGNRNGRALGGNGYLEMTGYPAPE
jgi:predicted secreted hydrolase